MVPLIETHNELGALDLEFWLASIVKEVDNPKYPGSRELLILAEQSGGQSSGSREEDSLLNEASGGSDASNGAVAREQQVRADTTMHEWQGHSPDHSSQERGDSGADADVDSERSTPAEGTSSNGGRIDNESSFLEQDVPLSNVPYNIDRVDTLHGPSSTGAPTSTLGVSLASVLAPAPTTPQPAYGQLLHRSQASAQPRDASNTPVPSLFSFDPLHGPVSDFYPHLQVVQQPNRNQPAYQPLQNFSRHSLGYPQQPIQQPTNWPAYYAARDGIQHASSAQYPPRPGDPAQYTRTLSHPQFGIQQPSIHAPQSSPHPSLFQPVVGFDVSRGGESRSFDASSPANDLESDGERPREQVKLDESRLRRKVRGRDKLVLSMRHARASGDASASTTGSLVAENSSVQHGLQASAQPRDASNTLVSSSLSFDHLHGPVSHVVQQPNGYQPVCQPLQTFSAHSQLHSQQPIQLPTNWLAYHATRDGVQHAPSTHYPPQPGQPAQNTQIPPHLQFDVQQAGLGIHAPQPFRHPSIFQPLVEFDGNQRRDGEDGPDSDDERPRKRMKLEESDVQGKGKGKGKKEPVGYTSHARPTGYASGSATGGSHAQSQTRVQGSPWTPASTSSGSFYPQSAGRGGIWISPFSFHSANGFPSTSRLDKGKGKATETSADTRREVLQGMPSQATPRLATELRADDRLLLAQHLEYQQARRSQYAGLAGPPVQQHQQQGLAMQPGQASANWAARPRPQPQPQPQPLLKMPRGGTIMGWRPPLGTQAETISTATTRVVPAKPSFVSPAANSSTSAVASTSRAQSSAPRLSIGTATRTGNRTSASTSVPASFNDRSTHLSRLADRSQEGPNAPNSTLAGDVPRRPSSSESWVRGTGGDQVQEECGKGREEA